MTRTERLFAIAEALRARRTGVTAELLAERFGVSVRTIYRDLDALREASLPLHSDRGRGGGYALDRTYALPPVNFTAREATLLLALGRWATDMRVLPFTTTLHSALDKVRGALPTATQRQLEQLLETVKFVGVPAQPSDDKVRAALERAFFESRALRIVYVSREHLETERVVRIESVVLERGETLLNCIDLDKNEARQLRLHRIARAEVVTEREESPSNVAPPFRGRRG
ncbi:helix-turn-helix transcriptional regulator [Sandaracinus amylolyticus]|uniref:Transcriptional regulator, DeoR family protein n=1 Tax=Sandaracinus amylolyticus TaxID=927083 RepID=A0A0F6SH28_9BACT|nr:HTH domain-containing protein [Sandaracinus amylolyticus]AKF09719.1 Transcriptional regulator, DeoR family protein [Sandaracinus amylolyticus]